MLQSMGLQRDMTEQLNSTERTVIDPLNIGKFACILVP